MKQFEEQALLKKAVAGDGQAFAMLLEAYYMVIYKMAFRWSGHTQDAEDIAQEVCVKVGRAIRGFRMGSKFSTWLYRIVLNTVNDLHRRSRDYDDFDQVKDQIADTGNTPEENLEDVQLWRQVRRLPEKQRDAVLLVYGEGFSHAEAAEMMDCAESTVSWYIHEAKKQLNQWMNDDGR